MKKPSSSSGSSRHRFNFWIDRDLLDGLRVIRERDGINESEQIRRAIRAWLTSREQGLLGRTARPKTHTESQLDHTPALPKARKPSKKR
jgi:hypothetical protein